MLWPGWPVLAMAIVNGNVVKSAHKLQSVFAGGDPCLR